MELDKYKLVQIAAPTYLEEIFKTDESIRLIYNNPPENALQDEDYIIPDKNSANQSNLDLTGNPLDIDLKGEDDLTGIVQYDQRKPDNWTDAEKLHYPLDINKARLLINTLNMNEAKTKKKADSKIFVVCDSKDSKKTFLLGCYNPDNTRLLVNNLGCLTRSDDRMQIENMKKKHYKNSGCVKNITYNASAEYLISGWNLKKYKGVPPFPYGGSLSVVWNKASYAPIDEDINNTCLKLQLYLGHQDSKFNAFWNHLILLYRCIEALSADELEELTFEEEPLELCDLYACITEMFTISRYVKKKPDDAGTKDVLELREDDLLDKLWKVLIGQNVDGLRNCFVHLFEEAAETEGIRYKIKEHYQSSVANILRGIQEGKLSVPVITHLQALKFFIELGIEKLHLDYFHIISYYSHDNYLTLTEQWDDLVRASKINEKDTRKTQHSSQVFAARSRKTFKPSAVETELLYKQFNCLINYHITVEYLHYAQSCLFSESTFKPVSENIFERFLPARTKIDFDSLRTDNLHEIKMDLLKFNANYLENCPMLSWNLKMTTYKNKYSSVSTIFHHSEKPLFPPNIYNEYSMPSGDIKENVFYALEAVVLIK